MSSARCPICRKPLTDAMREARPFCSARCRQVDLGRWLNEEYRISGSETDGTEEAAAASEGPRQGARDRDNDNEG
ncbi:DNA gyrase inhibitor YacG [Pendulispora albinea]|uniref:DNA gyrase inhibitor YacG n=1 Tax=Pendulispora albinea TaxID=2741071 RepID=A0ABZ2LSU0_9BACT